MSPSELARALAALVPTRRPVYLWGPPGCAKSSVVRQTADALKLDLADVRATLLDPVDLRGLPRVTRDAAVWCPPAFLPRSGEGILFLDELAQAPPLVQAACLQLVLDRRVGEYHLPDGWSVVAASNRAEDRAGTHRLISPLLNRFVHLDLEVSPDDWQDWGVTAGVAPEVRAFLRFRPALLFQFDPAANPRAFPTPRSWAFVADVLARTPAELLHREVAGCVGDGPAAEFVGFLSLYRELPDLDAALASPDATPVPREPAVLYALVGALVEKCKADAAPLGNFVKYATRLPDEFALLALRDALAVRPKMVALTPEADWDCETMATDGRALAYHPRFVAGLSPDELVGVLAHEVMHCALAHPGRRGVRDATRWNVACDLAVNPLLTEAGFVLPASRLMPGEGTYAHLPPGKSADEYYALLGPVPRPGSSDDAQPGEDGVKQSGDPGGCGSVTDPAGASPAQAEQTAAQWQVAVAQAEQAARGRGELPAGLGRTVDRVLRPPRDWREVLREFVAGHARNDYSWARPNRRFLWQGLYLPGLHSEELGDVVIAVDTSGSVGERELGVFAAEVHGILAAFDCAVTVLYHDTEVQRVQTWRSGDGELVLDPAGGGGTSHRCVFDWLDRSDLTPSCVVCLTDLETRFPDRVPATPVLWAVVGDGPTRPPFGRRVSVGG